MTRALPPYETPNESYARRFARRHAVPRAPPPIQPNMPAVPLPCPCCGGRAEIFKMPPSGTVTYPAVIGCAHCGVSTPAHVSLDAALRAWNLRPACPICTAARRCIAEAQRECLTCGNVQESMSGFARCYRCGGPTVKWNGQRGGQP